MAKRPEEDGGWETAGGLAPSGCGLQSKSRWGDEVGEAGVQGLVGASVAAVKEAGDWQAGDSGNASLRGPGAEQATTELLLCKMQSSPHVLKINLLWFSNEVTGGTFCAF